MNKKGKQINLSDFVDDIILFSSGSRISTNLILEALVKYEAISRKLVNKKKSWTILSPNSLMKRFLE